MIRITRGAGLAAIIAALAASAAPAQIESGRDPAAVQRLLADYIGLYRGETLERWRGHFLPTVTVASTNPDGSTAVRTLEEFYQAQKRRFDEGHAISEVLENVVIERRGRLASVWADFAFTMDGNARRGRLVMLLMAERGEFRIHSLMFSYDL